MAKKPLTFIINTLEVGGCERHLATVLPYLTSEWEVSVIIWGPNKGFFAPFLESKGITVIPLLKSSGWSHSFPLKPWISLIVRIFALKRYLKAKDPGILHFFLPPAYMVGILAARLARPNVPLIMARRSLNYYQRWPWSWIERYWHQFLFCATGNSQKVLSQLQEEGIAPEKLRLIYNGIAVKDFYQPHLRLPTRQALGFSDQDIVLINLANLMPYKGHEDFLEALAHLDPRLPWRVLCVGRDEGQGQALMKKSQLLGLSQRIQWLGLRHDIPALLAASDLSVLCSHEEGFSNTILESMAAGLPIVATNVGGNSEAIIHEETGCLVPAHDPVSLARALEELIRAPQKRHQWGQAGHNRAEHVFSLEACIKEYKALYKEVEFLS